MCFGRPESFPMACGCPIRASLPIAAGGERRSSPWRTPAAASLRPLLSRAPTLVFKSGGLVEPVVQHEASAAAVSSLSDHNHLRPISIDVIKDNPVIVSL